MDPTTYRTILLPLDGSTASELAVPYAALFPGSTVRLLRVEPPFQVLTPGPLENFRLDWQAVRTGQIEDELDPLAQRLRSQGQDVEVLVRFGDPAEEILAAAQDADLTVMTTQGRGTAGRALLGSVADRVCRHASIPVLVVRSTQAQPAPHVAQIVVPLDGSDLAEGALPHAAAIASALGVPVRLIRVVNPDDLAAAASPAAMNGDQTAASAYLEAIAEQLRARGLTTTVDVRTGAPSLVLLDNLRPDDLAIIASRGRGGIARWLLGSVADKLVRSAPAPVLLVRQRADA